MDAPTSDRENPPSRGETATDSTASPRFGVILGRGALCGRTPADFRLIEYQRGFMLVVPIAEEGHDGAPSWKNCGRPGG
jgi:hypothetical protein